MNIKFDLALYLFDLFFWWFWVLRFFVKTTISILNHLFNQELDIPIIEYERDSPKKKIRRKRKIKTPSKCVHDLDEIHQDSDSSEHLSSPNSSDEIVFSSSCDD